MASDQPDRLAELSRRLTEAGIEHDCYQPDSTGGAWIHVVERTDRAGSFVLLGNGNWIADSEYYRMSGVGARALSIASEVFGE